MNTMNIVRFQPFGEFDRVANHLVRRAFNQNFRPFAELEHTASELTKQVNTQFSDIVRAFDQNFGEFTSKTGLTSNRVFNVWSDAAFLGNSLLNTVLNGANATNGEFVPRMDVTENETSINLYVELAGLSKDDVSVTVSEDRILTIKGERKREATTEDAAKNIIRTERHYGTFARSFALPEYVNAESVSGKFENGVLALTLEKVEPVQPKQIEVKIK